MRWLLLRTFACVAIFLSASEAFGVPLWKRELVLPEAKADPIRRWALEAATAAYSIPDLESLRSASRLEEDYREFQTKIPRGYFLISLETDVESGLKAALLGPRLENASAPFILAITGTQSVTDWAANLNFGAAQLRGLQRLTRQVLRFFPDNSQIESGLLVTGHSLGGGLAQAIAFDLDRAMDQRQIDTPIYLVTWNAFGARELIRRVNPDYARPTTHVKIAWNYYVRGDPVSRIGSHVGLMFELQSNKKPGFFHRLPHEIAMHSLDTIREIAGEDGAGLRGVPYQRPPPATALNALSEVGGVFRLLPRVIFDVRYSKVADALGAKLDDLRKRLPLSKDESIFASYVTSLSEQVLESMRTNDNAGLSARVLREKLDRFQRSAAGVRQQVIGGQPHRLHSGMLLGIPVVLPPAERIRISPADNDTCFRANDRNPAGAASAVTFAQPSGWSEVHSRPAARATRKTALARKRALR